MGAEFGRFTIQANVRNLFDTYGVVSAGGYPFSVAPSLGGTSIPLINVGTIRPRTFSLTVGVRY
jgi:outer membrane receptor protein involved in Fe transport